MKHKLKLLLKKFAENKKYLRGTQLPNLSGNSLIRSSLIRSLSGPKMMTGLVYRTETFIKQPSHYTIELDVVVNIYTCGLPVQE